MRLKLSFINSLLAVLLLALGLYIIITPLLPSLEYKVQTLSQKNQAEKLSAKFSEPAAPADIPPDNRLVIPALFLDEKISQGRSIGVIDKGGTWLRPNSAYPTALSNTVIVGHRFTYNGPATFYNLDKIKDGDLMAVYWDGQRYVYKVRGTFITDAQDTAIESPSTSPELTLYTCTPLWSAKQRLVVKADLISPEPSISQEHSL